MTPSRQCREEPELKLMYRWLQCIYEFCYIIVSHSVKYGNLNKTNSVIMIIVTICPAIEVGKQNWLTKY